MKNFTEINRALAAKKNLKIFKLLVLVGVLITSINTSWAWSPVYLNGNFTGDNWGTNGNGSETYQVNYELDGSNSGHYFLPLYTSAGDKYWRFYEVKAWNDKYLNCPASDNYVMNVGTAAYQIEGGHKYNFKSTVDAGVVAVHIHQNYDGKGTSANGTNDRPRVWLERPTIYIWHNWNNNTANWNNNGGSGQKAMTDNQDGTYTYDGKFAGTSSDQNKTNVGIQGSAAIKKYFGPGAPTLVGSPTTGDMCRFTWNSNGYLGYDGETVNRGTLTITKLWKITYDGNGNEGGSAPDDEYVMHNTATATYTNTGSMTKTNMAFIGWNTQADGKGTHYDAGANITLTSNKTLYAEWVPCWVFRGGDSDGSNGSDAMGDWTPKEMTIIGTNAFMIELNLAASTTYQFKIVDRHNGKKADYSTWTLYGNNGTMSGTTLDWTFSTSEGNCKLSTGADGAGTWRFAWNASSKVLCVYKKDDATKSSFAQGKYIYFDARTNTTWQANPFNAKFYFKNLATGVDDGDITCNNTAKLDGWVYYALVPADKTWGAVQMNNLVVGTGAFRYDANTIYARGRTSANQNCMVTPSSGGSGITLTWGTYCPPKKTSTISDNSTVTYGGNGGSSTPFLVEKGGTIKVSASSTNYIEDGNMTTKYNFYDGSTSKQNGNGTTLDYTASATAGTTHQMKVNSYNYYNSTSSSDKESSILYYQTVTCWTISYSGNDNTGGTAPSTTKHMAGTSPTVAAKPDGFARANYSFAGWNTAADGSGTNYAAGSGTVSSIAANTPLYAKWTQSVTLDNTGYTSAGSTGVTLTYKSASHAALTAPERTNYTFMGWYTGTGGTGTQVINPSGVLQANVSGYTGASGIWTRSSATTLYAKWEEIPYTVTTSVADDEGGSVSPDEVTDAKVVTGSSTITATPENLAWRFKQWNMGDANVSIKTGSGTNAISVNATANSSVEAVFQPRYGLHGSLMDNMAGGMPGWAGDGADFTVEDFKAIDEGDGKGVDLQCARTLDPNKEYKFRVQDREAGSRWGYSESGHVLPAENPGKNIKLSTYGDENGKDVLINTVGYGTYTFKITNMYDNGDGTYYPAIEVERPASSQLTLGWKHYTNGELSEGNTGGTVTAETDEGDDGFAITNGQFYANGSTITFTAALEDGYHIVGWYQDASFETPYVSGSGGATISGDGDVTLELSSVSTNKTVYVKFAEDTKEASGSGGWASKVGASSLTDVVTIDGTITVDVAHALAKRVVLDQSADGKAGKLVITANKGLEVAEGILIKKSTGLEAPTAEDLVLESSASGNATLIFNNDNSAAATVGMYSKASVAGETWNWQYMASPYASANALHNYYGSYLYSWGNGDGSTTGWFPVPNGGSVEPFVAYCITNKTAGSYYQMDGTLVATDDNDQTISVPEGKSWVVGNSWTAPIQIGQLQDEDFAGLLKNVYLYNTGMDEAGEATMSEEPTGDDRYAANTYISIPIHSALYTDITVVSSLQGFYVKDDPSVAGGGTLILNYADHVRTNGVGSIQNGAMHAPKRVMAENNEPNVLKIKVCGSKYDDRLVLLERADFSMGYDAGWDGDKMGNVAASPRITVEREDGTSDAVSAVPDFEGLTISYRAANTDSEQTLYFEYSDETDPLYIVDVTNNEYIRVMTGNSYTFSTLDNEEHQRFILTRYGAPAITTGVDEVHNVSSARKQMIDGALYIIREGHIYNAEGALVK